MKILTLMAATVGSLILLNPASAQTWTQTGAPVQNWKSIASSADGTKLVAMGGNGNNSYVSTNSGVTWTLTPVAGGGIVASSTNGTKLVMVNGNLMYASTNSGNS